MAAIALSLLRQRLIAMGFIAVAGPIAGQPGAHRLVVKGPSADPEVFMVDDPVTRRFVDLIAQKLGVSADKLFA